MRILFCNCSYADAVPSEVKREVLARLSASRVAFDAVPDLCAAAAHGDPLLKDIAGSGQVRIAACFPRTVRWLFHAAGTPLSEGSTELLNMRREGADDLAARLLLDVPPREGPDRTTGNGCGIRLVLYEGPGSTPLHDDKRVHLLTSLLERGYAIRRVYDAGEAYSTGPTVVLVSGPVPRGAEPTVGEGGTYICDISGLDVDGVLAQVERIRQQVGLPEPGAWKPWFPVIDYDRCANCQQCLSFCLFGVFGTDPSGLVEVRNQQRCKTGCPACARVCPEVAIMFPKHDKSPINGDVVREADVQREAMKVDVSGLLGGDTSATLRRRSGAVRARFSTKPDSSRTLGERARRLEKVKDALEIPDEVLKSLSSTDGAEQSSERAGPEPAQPQAGGPAETQPPSSPSDEEWEI